MTANFAGKSVLITGAGMGIGRATAVAFGREGASVLVADLDEAAASTTVQLVEKAGGRARFVKCNVADPADAKRAVEVALATYGKLDVAFNNAGVAGAQSALEEYPLESWAQVIGVNLSGVFYCMRFEVAAMLAQGGGVIVNNASILGLVGFAGSPAYVAAKHGVLGITKAAGVEYAARGIRVNAVCPGFIETPMLERAGLTTNAAARTMLESLHPMKRLGRAEEIAEVVLWLSSPAASFVTGAAFLADGGYVAQ